MIQMKDVEPLTLEKIPEIWEAYKKENFDIPQDPRDASKRFRLSEEVKALLDSV